jgi:hypothetical protein
MVESLDMKTLLVGIVLIVVLGLGGFLYRNVVEHPPAPAQIACTLEAKSCPDGTTVGRSGPNCSFAPCLAPNVFIDSLHIGFALPAGYAADENAAGANNTLVGAFVKVSSTTNALNTITIRAFPIPTGSTTDEVILAHTRLQPSDMQPKNMNAFKPKIIGIRTFSAIVIERFEGIVHTAYFLPRKNDVLEFDIVEQDVLNWTSPNLITDNLPHHQALIKMLGTLQDSSL